MKLIFFSILFFFLSMLRVLSNVGVRMIDICILTPLEYSLFFAGYFYSWIGSQTSTNFNFTLMFVILLPDTFAFGFAPKSPLTLWFRHAGSDHNHIILYYIISFYSEIACTSISIQNSNTNCLSQHSPIHSFHTQDHVINSSKKFKLNWSQVIPNKRVVITPYIYSKLNILTFIKKKTYLIQLYSIQLVIQVF